jgi:DNA primase
VLPDGLDPDEIVLRSPQQWREAIAGARPIVEHVIDALLGAHDLSGPRGKSDAVKAIAPILKDLSDPVQRDYYTQQIARRLQLSARAVSESMGGAWSARRSTHPPSGPEADPAAGGPDAKSARAPSARRADLELHLVALLARQPQLLMDANVVLTRANLDVLGADDFANPALRVGYNQLSRAATGQPLPEADDDWLTLVADHPPLGDDEAILREETIRTALRLRLNNLDRERTALASMIEQAPADGEPREAAQYNLMLRDVAARHFRAQKALRLRGMSVVG